MGVQAKGYPSDVASFAGAHAVVEDVKTVFGRIDILVNNAGITKAGLIGPYKSLAKEMGARGVRSNCIAPGFIATDMTNSLPENLRQEWEKQITMRRGGTPEDVAGVAVFLASDLSSYFTGQVINCCAA